LYIGFILTFGLADRMMLKQLRWCLIKHLAGWVARTTTSGLLLW